MQFCSRMAYILFAFAGLCGLWESCERTATAADWPQFLGPQRNGVSLETGLIDTFPAEGPRQVWRRPGGVGMSGVSVAHGLACTLVQRDGQQWALALDAATGAERWQTPLAPEYQNGMGDGPRATPAITDAAVFVHTGEGILAALDRTDGHVLWTRQPVKDFGGEPAEYGMASSPLVHAGRVIVHVGAPQATLAAYDAATGSPVWQVGAEDAAGYSSPTLLTIGGREQVVAFTGRP